MLGHLTTMNETKSIEIYFKMYFEMSYRSITQYLSRGLILCKNSFLYVPIDFQLYSLEIRMMLTFIMTLIYGIFFKQYVKEAV